MLSTGIRTDVGIKIYGQSLDTINRLAQEFKKALQGMDGIEDLYVEPITGGKYIDIRIRREELGRYGLSVNDINMFIETALGGANITQTVEARRRFSISVRMGQDFRNTVDKLNQLPIITMNSGPIPLSAVADVVIEEGPPMISSENAMLRGTLLFNVRERDLGSTVDEAKQKLEIAVKNLPKGYFLDWSGQYENQIRAEKKITDHPPDSAAGYYTDSVFHFSYYQGSTYCAIKYSRCTGWWSVFPILFRCEFFSCCCRRFYCPFWNCGRDRSFDACISE